MRRLPLTARRRDRGDRDRQCSDRRIKAGVCCAPHGTASTTGAAAYGGSAQPEKSNAEHRRHNGRPRTIGQLCCSIARKGVRYLRRCRTAGNDPDAKPACGTPRARRHAAAVVSFHLSSRYADSRGKHHHGLERAPGAPRRGREAQAQHHRTVRRHSPPAGISAPAGKQINKQNIPQSRPEPASAGHRNKSQFNALSGVANGYCGWIR